MHPPRCTARLQLPCISTRVKNFRQPRERDRTLSLNAAVDGSNLAKEASSIVPAKAAFRSVTAILTMIRVSSFTKDKMVKKRDYIELGLLCADICGALERGMSGKKLNDLSESLYHRPGTDWSRRL